MRQKYPENKYPKKKQSPKDTANNEPKRNTHSINAGLEDAIALLWEILDYTARAFLFIRSRARRIASILKTMRAGPHKYRKDERYDGKK